MFKHFLSWVTPSEDAWLQEEIFYWTAKLSGLEAYMSDSLLWILLLHFQALAVIGDKLHFVLFKYAYKESILSIHG